MESEIDYWSVIEPIWHSISIHQRPEAFLAQFAKATQPQQTLYAAHWCQGEVLNGGLWQFFINSTGVLCPEAIQAYQTIGMPLLSSLLREAASWFGREYPRSKPERRQLLSAAGWGKPERNNPFSSQTERFLNYHKEESGGFVAAANRFATQNCS